MPEDLYPEPDDQTPFPEDDAQAPEATEDGGEGKTALVPKSVLGGKDFKVGEEVVLKITHIYEDEVAVEYATEKPKADKSTPDEDIDAMDRKESYASSSY